MQKTEFEKRIGKAVTNREYEVIEEVYMWHPAISKVCGEEDVAELYKCFGMTIFYDMLPRAVKAKVLDELLCVAQDEVKRLEGEIRDLSLE